MSILDELTYRDELRLLCLKGVFDRLSSLKFKMDHPQCVSQMPPLAVLRQEIVITCKEIISRLGELD